MNGRTVKSALNPDPQSLWAGMGCSVFLHGSLGLFAVVVSWVGPLLLALFPSCQEQTPLISESMEVSVAVLPRRLNVPDKAERAPKVEQQDAPVTKAPEPEPVKESDLVVNKEQAEPDPAPAGNDDETDDDVDLQALQDLVADVLDDAPVGKTNRLPTDPDGEVGVDPMVASLRAGAKGDPLMAKWTAAVKAKVKEKFKPIGPRDDLEVVVHVWLDPNTGKIKRYTVAKPSGVLAFDSAAKRAIAATGTIPVPPTKYKPLLAVEYVEFTLEPPR